MSALMDDITALRLRLLENGFTPLANVSKLCVLAGWPKLAVDEALIRKWGRMRRYQATGVRLAGGLTVIDVDINDKVAAQTVYDAMCKAVPRLADVSVLERSGKGYKIALFCRTSELFSRIHSRRWLPAGADTDGETACVEIFGGASHRQFGSFGPHTRLDNGEVPIEYGWNGASPAEVPLAELARFSKAEFFAMVNAAEAALRSIDWEPVKLSEAGENDAVRVYDLVESMVFHLADGRELTLAELREVAQSEDHLRCSASWLEGPSAKRADRCLIGRTANRALAIWESASGVTHHVRTPIHELIANNAGRGPLADIVERIQAEQRRRAEKRVRT